MPGDTVDLKVDGGTAVSGSPPNADGAQLGVHYLDLNSTTVSATVTPHLHATDPFGQPVTWQLTAVQVTTEAPGLGQQLIQITAGGEYNVTVIGPASNSYNGGAAGQVQVHVASKDKILEPVDSSVTLDAATGLGTVRVKALRPGSGYLILSDVSGETNSTGYGVGIPVPGAHGTAAVGNGVPEPVVGDEPYFEFGLQSDVAVTLHYHLEGDFDSAILNMATSGTRATAFSRKSLSLAR